jgi:tubulin polyglutamylase complex subunit 2
MSVNSEQDEPQYRSPKHALFDSIGFNMISYLESFDEVTDIDIVSQVGVQSMELNLWDRKNAPYELPMDVKGFYSLFNGFVLRWKVEIADHEVIMGEIKLNKIDYISPIVLNEGMVFILPPDMPSGLKVSAPNIQSCAAFTLSNNEDGQVAIFFKTRPPSGVVDVSGRHMDSARHADMPEIWFQDLSGKWHFVCFSFSQYMRLCVMHLGIIGWHYIFTPAGISLTCRQWMGMFCKERLCVYEHSRSAFEN